MPIYKILNICSDLVVSGDEHWDSLADALNELASAHWELQHLLGVALPESRKLAAVDWVASAVLVNRIGSMRDDLERQIAKLHTETLTAEKRRDALPPTGDIRRFTVGQDIEELGKKVERLRQQQENAG